MSTPIEIRVGTLVNGMGAALCEALEQAEESTGVTKPKFCSVLPGAVVALDYCGEGGMAWSRLVGIRPVQVQEGRICVIQYDVIVELAVMRCAPIIEEDGELPSEAEQLAAAMLQNYDMGLMHKVLTCTSTPNTFTFQSMGEFLPYGPEGQCVGGIWSAVWRTE